MNRRSPTRVLTVVALTVGIVLSAIGSAGALPAPDAD
jgi:hypothetical protein